MDVYFKAGNTPSFGAFVIFNRATPAGVAILASCGAPFPVHDLGRKVFEAVLPLASSEQDCRGVLSRCRAPGAGPLAGRSDLGGARHEAVVNAFCICF
jgi:hypothetical protein